MPHKEFGMRIYMQAAIAEDECMRDVPKNFS
jgi:hypothetical protein